SFISQDKYWNQSDSGFFLAASDPSTDHYVKFQAYAGDPRTNPRWEAPYGPDMETAGDKFWMPALQVQWGLPAVDVIYNASYFHRNYFGNRDATPLYAQLFLGNDPLQI